MARGKPKTPAFQSEGAEGSATEEATESPRAERSEDAAGPNDHPVTHRPRAGNSPYPV